MTGYIKGKNKVVKVRVVEYGPDYKILETEKNELIYVPDNVKIWATEQECKEQEKNPLDWCVM